MTTQEIRKQIRTFGSSLTDGLEIEYAFGKDIRTLKLDVKKTLELLKERDEISWYSIGTLEDEDGNIRTNIIVAFKYDDIYGDEKEATMQWEEFIIYRGISQWQELDIVVNHEYVRSVVEDAVKLSNPILQMFRELTQPKKPK